MISGQEIALLTPPYANRPVAAAPGPTRAATPLGLARRHPRPAGAPGKWPRADSTDPRPYPLAVARTAAADLSSCGRVLVAGNGARRLALTGPVRTYTRVVTEPRRVDRSLGAADAPGAGYLETKQEPDAPMQICMHADSVAVRSDRFPIRDGCSRAPLDLSGRRPTPWAVWRVCVRHRRDRFDRDTGGESSEQVRVGGGGQLSAVLGPPNQSPHPARRVRTAART